MRVYVMFKLNQISFIYYIGINNLNNFEKRFNARPNIFQLIFVFVQNERNIPKKTEIGQHTDLNYVLSRAQKMEHFYDLKHRNHGIEFFALALFPREDDFQYNIEISGVK